MKLGLSKKGDPRGRHLVMVLDRAENMSVSDIIFDQILGDDDPVKEWDPERMVFVYRFHVRYLDRIMLSIPYIEMSPALDKWFIEQQRKAFKQLPVPDIDIPGFYDYLMEESAEPFDFQKIGIDQIERELDKIADEWDDFMSHADHVGEEFTKLPAYLLNDELGLGKTVMALAVMIRQRLFPALYVAPVSGKFSTERIIKRFFDDDFTYEVVDGTRLQRANQILSRPDLTIVNFEQIRVHRNYNRSTRLWEYKFHNPELFFETEEQLDPKTDYVNVEPRDFKTYRYVVIDEHHRVKTEGNLATNGFFELLGDYWLLMSGTPIMNRIEEIWTVLHKIDPERWPTLYLFEKWITIKNSAGEIVGYDPEAMKELRDYLHSRSIRRRRDHVSDQMPEVVYIQRDVELTPEQRKLYKLILDELTLLLEDGSKKTVKTMMIRMQRLKEACFSPELYGGSKHSAKIVAMKEDVAQLVASNEKAIIFSPWSRATRILEREFAQYNPAYVDGTVKGKHRTAQEDKFNYDDDCKLYIGTIGANKEAISLQAASYVLFASKDWNPQANHQAIGRSAAGGLRGIHLPKGSKVHVLDYYALDTVEEYIEEMLRRKQALFNVLVERDGGMRFPRFTMTDVRSLLGAGELVEAA